MQEQQLLARQMVLQQQAASAVAAASKTQREVRARARARGARPARQGRSSACSPPRASAAG